MGGRHRMTKREVRRRRLRRFVHRVRPIVRRRVYEIMLGLTVAPFSSAELEEMAQAIARDAMSVPLQKIPYNDTAIEAIRAKIGLPPQE